MTTQTRPPPTKEAIRLTNFWQKFGPNTYPLNIQRLIEGAIHSSSFDGRLETEVGSFDSFEGALVRKNNTKEWTILLNGNVENERRMRFTYAHELGHFMCHRHLRDKFEDSDKTLNDFRDTVETEANLFASWLLMPANVLRSEFGTASWHTDTLREVASRFECSLQSGALRFVKLSVKPIAFVVSRDGMICWACKSESAPYMSAYCFGNELPEKSLARLGKLGLPTCLLPQDSGHAWSETQGSIESNYFDSSGLGYQYTCIEFNS